jgi:uncharacterized protein YecE (DUF72 family)
MYYSAYDDERLDALAAHLVAAPKSRRPWCIFDNTAHGHAIEDALRLRGRLEAAATASGTSRARRAG